MSNAKVEVIRTTFAPDDQKIAKNDILNMLKNVFKHLLSKPEVAKLDIIEGEQTTIIEVDIDEKDFGRLLGAKGKTISALRTTVNAIAASRNFRAIIRIKNEERFY